MGEKQRGVSHSTVEDTAERGDQTIRRTRARASGVNGAAANGWLAWAGRAEGARF